MLLIASNKMYEYYIVNPEGTKSWCAVERTILDSPATRDTNHQLTPEISVCGFPDADEAISHIISQWVMVDASVNFNTRIYHYDDQNTK